MNEIKLSVDEIAALSALANGIIPADEHDAGAAAVHAGPGIAERIRRGVNGPLYAEGLQTAEGIALEKFGRAPGVLRPLEIHELLDALEKASPRFFRQLRADVCSLYMSDPAVWQRIGFPGPSTDTGGYPDFDQPQSPGQDS
jgi:hypothetical protein